MHKVNVEWRIDNSEQPAMLEIMQACQLTIDTNAEIKLIVEFDRVAIAVDGEIYWCDKNDKWHQNILYTVKYDNSALAKALALRPGMKILDATAGFGRDAFTMSVLRASVVAIEKNPIIAAMLMWTTREMSSLNAMYGDHAAIITTNNWDGIYFDFMFDKNNRKSKSHQGMEIIAKIASKESITSDTWHNAIAHSKRVVVKRPKNKLVLAITQKPNHSITTKTVCFDVYLGDL